VEYFIKITGTEYIVGKTQAIDTVHVGLSCNVQPEDGLQPKSRRRPGHANNFAPFEPIFFKIFALGQGRRILLRAHAQAADKFPRALFGCRKPECASVIFPIILVTFSALHRLARLDSCPAGPPLRPALPEEIPLC
jgi:hypothetical protein